MSHPEYQFPEMYVQGRAGFGDDLERVLHIVQRAPAELDPNQPARRLLSTLFRRRSGSLARAGENIHSHYDLGNDFYKLAGRADGLHLRLLRDAVDVAGGGTKAEMNRVCRKLRLRSGERVVEAGCGWGAFALHMASHFGVKVRAFNISRSQLEFARERAAREGLGDAVEFVEGDYREIAGNYDAFVSVGMLEHVGPEYYPELGQIMDRTLPANGRGLIHTIGTDRPGLLNTWIERRIFPGAYPPSLGEMMPLFGPSHFSILDVENLRLHYALTLRHWLQRFYASQDKVLEMFDQEFVRAWRFYLVSSETAFTNGLLQLVQVLFARKGSNDIPWTRAYLEASGCP